MKNAMLRRTPFKRQTLERKPQPLYALTVRRVNVAKISVEAKPQPKENAVRSEPYRRLVAALPCMFCGLEGSSQAAHPPPSGKGIKEDDRYVFPLCCTRPNRLGCHPLFDLYKLMPADDARIQARVWAHETRERIVNDGDWPKGLERV